MYLKVSIQRDLPLPLLYCSFTIFQQYIWFWNLDLFSFLGTSYKFLFKERKSTTVQASKMAAGML